MWLGSDVAVAVAFTCSSDSTPSLGTSICHRWVPKKTKKEKEKKKKHIFAPMILYLQKQIVNWIWPMNYSFLTPINLISQF